MLLGKIIGTAVATQKYSGMDGAKLLVVQPLDKQLRPRGSVQVAVDTPLLSAGVNDVVYLVRSREAMLAYDPNSMLPIDLAVVGVVERVDVLAEAELSLVEGVNRFHG